MTHRECVHSILTPLSTGIQYLQMECFEVLHKGNQAYFGKMADMAEYDHQLSEIQKAVREREIHRLELEKQRLRKTHRREKRRN